MATQMHPEHGSRVFAAATDKDSLADLKQLEYEDRLGVFQEYEDRFLDLFKKPE